MKYSFLLSLLALLSTLNFPAFAQWTRVAEINEMTYSFAQSDSTLFVGADTRIHLSTDGGKQWTASSVFPEPAEGALALAIWNDHLFVGTATEGVFASSDRGTTWYRFGTSDPRMGITTLLVYGDTLYAGTDGFGIFAVSLLQNGVWRQVNSGLPSSIAHTINTLHATPTHFLAGAGINGHVYSRKFGDESWTPVPLAPPNGTVTAYAFMTIGDSVLSAGSAGIRRGPLDGSRWMPVGTTTLPSMHIVTLTSFGDRMFAGLSNGVEFYVATSRDAGSTWTVADHWFGNLIALRVQGDRLYAACEDGLRWRNVSELLSTPPLAQPSTARLVDVHPLPIASHGTVSFQLDTPTGYSLQVVDLLGRVVATLSHGRLDAGTHSRRFEAANMTSGVYLLCLETPDGRDTRLFTIAR